MSKPLEGKLYLYNGEQHKILRIVLKEGDTYDIYTDKRHIRIHKRDFSDFLPIDGRSNDKALMLFVRDSNKPLDDLSQKLMNSITKIESDKTYIEQAQAINETAKTLISLRKAQIDLLKVVKGNNR